MSEARAEPGGPRPASAAEDAVPRARRFLEDHLDEEVTLERLAGEVGVSPFHLQRTFKRVVGLSPKAYQDAKRLERMKARLRAGDTVSRATFEAGFGSSRAVYEKADSGLGMTPGAYRRGGEGMTIRHQVGGTEFGDLIVAATERGICFVSLGESEGGLIEALRREYPRAALRPADGALASWVQAIRDHLAGRRPGLDLPTDLTGTEFQRRVWRALQEIPYGETRSYKEVAGSIGRPTAARAVARACATNPVPLVVPCHRVVRSSGELGGYGLGVELKERLLEREGGSSS